MNKKTVLTLLTTLALLATALPASAGPPPPAAPQPGGDLRTASPAALDPTAAWNSTESDST